MTKRSKRMHEGKPQQQPPFLGGKGLFIAGTDTGVGKTVVACALAGVARSAGISVAAYKPLETGCRGAANAGEDALALARATGTDPKDVAELCFRDSLAPAVAAEREGLGVDLDGLRRHYERLRIRNRLVLVEGAGGVAVPVDWQTTFLDLAETWGLDAIVVARTGLGTINHVMLTVQALRQRGITVRALVLNRRRARPDLAEQTNPESLGRLLPGVPLFVLPEGKGPSAEAVAATLRRSRRGAFQRLLAACSIPGA